MPKSAYFKGSGEKVLRRMKRRYGDERGERIFHATAEKTGMKPSKRRSKMMRDYMRKR